MKVKGIVRKKLNSQSGFNLTEMLVTILLMTIVLGAVTSGIEAARRAYKSVKLKADGQMLLATSITELSAEFERARLLNGSATLPSIETPISNFYSEVRGGNVTLNNDKLGVVTSEGEEALSNTDGHTGIFLSSSDSTPAGEIRLVTDDMRGMPTLYTKLVAVDGSKSEDKWQPMFYPDAKSSVTGDEDDEKAKKGGPGASVSDKAKKEKISGYIEFRIEVYNHKAGSTEDDELIAGETVRVRPALCQ